MSEHANIRKNTNFNRKYKDLDKLIGLKSIHIEFGTIDENDNRVIFHARSRNDIAVCPCCGQRSNSVHSSYTRKIADLPVSGRNVSIVLTCRRFRCHTPHEDGKLHIFSERFDDVRPYGRRSIRVDENILRTSIEISARKAEHIMSLQGIRVSDTTCLRIIMREPLPDNKDVRHIGIDDWAWRKGMRYGTQIIDQDTGSTIALLKTRNAADIEEWLGKHKKIELITRDRDKGYGSACRKGAPQAEQIADKFHLTYNLSDRIRKTIRDNCVSVYSCYSAWLQRHDSELLSSMVLPPSFNVQFDNRVGFEEDISDKDRKDFDMVRMLQEKGMQVRDIAGKLHIDRSRVWMFCHHDIETINSVKKPDKNKALYERFIPLIVSLCNKGRPLREIYGELSKKGLNVTFGQFKYWFEGYNPDYTAKRKENLNADTDKMKKKLLKYFSEKSIGTITLYVTNPDYGTDRKTGELSLTARLINEAVKTCPMLGYLRNLYTSFRKVIAGNNIRAIDDWMDKYRHTQYPEIASFWDGLYDDKEAVTNAIKYDYTNGIVEGKNHRLKNKKREGYGRSSFELLQRKVILSKYG